MGVRADGKFEADQAWPVEGLDVVPRFRPADNYGGQAVTSMTLRFAGGVTGILAPIDFDSRVCIVVDGIMVAHSHRRKRSDKATVFELTHTIRPEGGYIVEMDRGGLELINACQGAHAKQFSSHGGELQGLDI